MDRDGNRHKPLAVRDLRRVTILKGYAMDGMNRGGKPPLQVCREFSSGRLEVQVLTQTYELIVPVIRERATMTQSLRILSSERQVETPTRRMAQGA
jgi:hypothetical protein